MSNLVARQRQNEQAKKIVKHLFSTQVISVIDSEARDHLANERTFLAWIRTGFGVTAVGVVISRLSSSDRSDTSTKILSLMYILLGLFCALIGLIRHIHVQMLLEDKKYPMSGLTIMIVMIVGTITFITTFVLLLLN